MNRWATLCQTKISRHFAVALGCFMVLSNAAQACEAALPYPSDEQIRSVTAPKTGIIGIVIKSSEEKPNGEATVQVRVEQAYGQKVAEIILIKNPGCCVCVDMPTTPGAKVETIISPGENNIFNLAY